VNGGELYANSVFLTFLLLMEVSAILFQPLRGLNIVSVDSIS
jgi:hypothetical protein